MFGKRGTQMTLILAAVVFAIPAFAGDKSDLAGRVEAWEQAFNAGDAEGIAALYTEDAARLPYQAPTISGREEIAGNIRTTRDAGIVKIDLELLGAESRGSMGWGHGTYALMDASGATVQEGKWMNVSKKIGGTWYIHADIWNTDAP